MIIYLKYFTSSILKLGDNSGAYNIFDAEPDLVIEVVIVFTPFFIDVFVTLLYVSPNKNIKYIKLPFMTIVSISTDSPLLLPISNGNKFMKDPNKVPIGEMPDWSSSYEGN